MLEKLVIVVTARELCILIYGTLSMPYTHACALPAESRMTVTMMRS